MEMSALDTRILKHCLEHGVLASERDMAAKLRISPSTFSFKMRRFEDKGIITAYKYRVDYAKIGLHQMAWGFYRLHFGRLTPKDAMAKLLEYPQVHVCLFTTGENNLAIKAYSDSRKSMEEFFASVKKDFRGALGFGNACFVKRQVKGHNQPMDDAAPQTAVDETDFRILSQKMLNPEMPLREVAKKLRMHRNTAMKRWARMIEDKVVMKKTPIINPDFHREIGIYLMAVNLFSTRRPAERLAQSLSALNEVHELDILDDGKGGEHSLLAVLRTADIDEYYRLAGRLYSDRKYSQETSNMKSKIIITSDSRRHSYLKDIGFGELAGK
ncbi:MAG: Lrp/AsnC family transcriptional regulator [Candidatus Diapherotrites archaeon]|uniref:Lrp/AsnC family transcriptional regulator n=1 Tax=Candidatus Iainarchaeum sp. TaxID=3101447 RepID=A0A8T3YPD1_9ARCH|nr:Lrp/AsnC family transcriptional regulator [Candidatus Diapherotrites archaeon]